MKSILPWVIAALAVGIALFQSVKPPRVNTVTKTVPVDVVREVTVVKEVEKQLTPEQLSWMQLGSKLHGASVASMDIAELLKNMRSLRVVVKIPEALSADVRPDEIKTGIELELRKVGVNVNEDALTPVLLYQIDGRYFDESTYTYTEKLAVFRAGFIPTPDSWLIKSNMETYSIDSFGRIGKSRIKDLNDSFDSTFKSFLNDYLKANPLTK